MRIPAIITAAAAATVLLSACTVTPPHVTVTGPTVAIVAPVAPPPARIEVMAAQPGRDYFWVPGYWHWEGERHRWVEGRWERHREHERWVERHWEHEGDGRWRLHGGYWHRD